MDYYRISAEKLGEGSKIPIVKLTEVGEVFYELALEMIRTIESRNAEQKNTVMILPVGPTGQYPVFVRLVNERKLSLKNCWIIMMDEYLDDNEQWISMESPLSFRRHMEKEFYSKIDKELLMPQSQLVFPDPNNLGQIPELIEKLGGVDLCIAGFGINGHVAYNEPQPELSPDELASLKTRIVDASPHTRTRYAIDELGGAMDALPKRVATVGLWEILGARVLRFGCFRDWHSGVLRKAAYGEISSEFPGTLVQRHPDALVYASANVVRQPI